MKQRVLSLFLVAVMILSTFAIIPVTAAENTWSGSNYVISTAADMAAFEAAVEGGNNFSGQTVKLAADVVLPSSWNGIGARSDKPFKGTFDGQGHTITMSSNTSSDINGALFCMVTDATIKNLTLDGSLVWGSANFQGGLVNTAAGNTTIENVRVSLAITNKSGTNVSYAGGFVGFHDNSSSGTLTIDGCVFDGSIVCKSYATHVAAFIGYSGNFWSSTSKTMIIKNSVYAGTMSLGALDESTGCAIFIGYVLGSSNGTTKATVQDCISIGSVVFPTEGTYDSKDKNAIAIGRYTESYTALTIKNLYYVDQINSQKTGNLLVTDTGSGYTSEGTVKAMTKDEIGALTAANFSSDAKLSFKDNTAVATYYPCPTGLVPAEGWLNTLATTINVVAISSLADLQAFEANVESGKNYAGETVMLLADITLPEDWNGIGARADYPFSGIFDGNGYTITMSNHNTGSTSGALFCMVKNGTIKNLKLDGKIRWGAQNFQAGLVNCVAGDVTIENVQVSLNIESNNGIVSYAGGFVGFHDNSSTGMLVIDSCLFDGSILCKNQAQYVSAFIGYTGNAFASTSKTFVIKNSVYAGSMTFRDKDETRGCAIFVGYALGKAEVNPKVTVQDCISIGTIAFHNENAFSDSDLNAIVFGNYDGGKVTLAVKNLYYVDQANSQKTGNLLISSDGNGYTASGTVKAMTKAEIASLTAANFSADAKMSFNNTNGVNIYYPCPTGLVPAEGWLTVLKYLSGSANVLGAQIRCTGEGDQYSGIRFVGLFEADAVSGAGTADANFGLILISKAFYDAAEDKNSITGLLTAGGYDVQASQVDDSMEGYYRVNAVVYEITADHYTDEIVAVAYINGELVGDATIRSIYEVATKCLADSNATAAQQAFCQEIVNTVNG